MANLLGFDSKLNEQSAKDGVHGILRCSTASLLFSARPILPSSMKGSNRGWLVMARALGQAEVEKLRAVTQLDLRIRQNVRRSGLPGDQSASADLKDSVSVPEMEHIFGRLLPLTAGGYIRDINGAPIAMLTVRVPREIHKMLLSSISTSRSLLILGVLIFGAVIVFVLERYAFSRLSRLSREVSQIQCAGNSKVSAEGKDEVSYLGTMINGMLEKLHRSEELLRSHNETLEQTVTERTKQIEHQALHDKLTGLPNRSLFMDRVQHALQKEQRTHLGAALLFVDLDNFKIVNDSLGHVAGDELLTQVATRLLLAVRPGDTVARFGGDEFTILLEDIESFGEVEKIAERLLQSLRDPVALNGREAFASASIGVAFTGGSFDGERVLKNADVAMYRAKASGKSSFMVYDESMSEDAAQRLELETGLRRALERGEISVHYQPLISLEDGSLSGAEALARWQHPELGFVSPVRFIPIAEETGLIVPIGYWVLKEACRQTVEWRRKIGCDKFQISVNLSGLQMQKADVVERVTQILNETGLPPSALKLEITETILMTNGQDALEKLRKLKALGVALALDDFGTGYSSLATLSEFPIDTLKIDRAFIKSLGDGKEPLAIVKAIMVLSKTMKLDVTAEGVETKYQSSMIRKLGCKTGQGYLFDKPLSSKHFMERLEIWRDYEFQMALSSKAA